MYQYRVIEALPDSTKIVHHAMDNEDDARNEAKRIVVDTHHTCFIERHNGKEWQLGSIRYCWVFDRLCFYNHR